MTTTHALIGELPHHQALVADLRRRFPDADDDTIADTVAGMSDLEDMLAEVARSVADDEAAAAACKMRIDDMATRKKRHEDRAETKRDCIAKVMERAGLRKITAPDVTLSLGKGRAKVVITDESAVLKDGYGITPPDVIDKKALRVALEAGDKVEGATLGNSIPVLTMRLR